MASRSFHTPTTLWASSCANLPYWRLAPAGPVLVRAATHPQANVIAHLVKAYLHAEWPSYLVEDLVSVSTRTQMSPTRTKVLRVHPFDQLGDGEPLLASSWTPAKALTFLRTTRTSMLGTRFRSRPYLIDSNDRVRLPVTFVGPGRAGRKGYPSTGVAPPIVQFVLPADLRPLQVGLRIAVPRTSRTLATRRRVRPQQPPSIRSLYPRPITHGGGDCWYPQIQIALSPLF